MWLRKQRVCFSLNATRYLKLQDILHAGRFSIAHARMKEAGGNGHPQRLTRHPRVRPDRIARDHTERPEEQHQQLLSVHWQGGD